MTGNPETTMAGHNVGISGKVEGLFRLQSFGLPVPKYKTLYARENLQTLKEPGWQEFLQSATSFAVRSSAFGEDGEENSFAGVFDTYLHVAPGEVVEAVKKVRNSLESANASVYEDARAHAMDVIVQEMVPSAISGILFTAHPRGLRNEIVFQVAFGTGDGLVEGRSAQTSYFYNPEIESLYYVKEENSPLLEEKLLRKLLDHINDIKKQESCALDIEFAIHQGRIYFLQSRPITTITEKIQVILDNSNIVESYPGTTLPLSASFGKLAYRGVFEALVTRMLGKAARKQDFWPRLSQMVMVYQGRMYYQISNWYFLLKSLPFSKKFIPIWQESMGVQNKSFDAEPVALPPMLRVRFFLRLLHNMLTLPSKMRKLDYAFRAVEENYRAQKVENMTSEQLLGLFRSLQEELLQYWDLTLLNDLYAFLFTGILRKRMQRLKGSISNEELVGIDSIASMAPIEALQQILQFEEGSPDYVRVLEEFLERYGDRAPEELKLESQTFRRNPETLDRMLADFRAQEIHLQTGKTQKSETGTSKNGSENSSKGNAKAGFLQNFFRKRARLGIKNREMSRFHRSRIYGMVREIVWTLGERLAEASLLDQSEDIFYLNLDECFNHTFTDLRKTVAFRRRKQAFYEQLPAYPHLEFCGQVFEKQEEALENLDIQAEAHELRGQPCSDGSVEGEVLVVLKPDEKLRPEGKILVAPFTDPAWAYLLVRAKGLITEKGSLLSHTGIISRELGIPCITQVPLACRRVRTGDHIRMNGTTGEIEILDGSVPEPLEPREGAPRDL